MLSCLTHLGKGVVVALHWNKYLYDSSQGSIGPREIHGRVSSSRLGDAHTMYPYTGTFTLLSPSFFLRPLNCVITISRRGSFSFKSMGRSKPRYGVGSINRTTMFGKRKILNSRYLHRLLFVEGNSCFFMALWGYLLS